MEHVLAAVLLPYKITLLSNTVPISGNVYGVLLPYKITLLSNLAKLNNHIHNVLLPYKITLLSNLGTPYAMQSLMFYYPIKLHYSQTL